MKRNWFVIGLMFLLTVGLWAQVSSNPAPQAPAKTSCACCNHDASSTADGKAKSCCSGKDGMACSRKDGKSCCAGMKGMKMDASASNQAMSCGKDCCGKDCCKDGKCQMAKNGKKCCDNCPGMAEGK